MIPLFRQEDSIFIGPRSDHSLPMSLTNWLTDSLTHDLVEDWMNWPKYADYADYSDHADYVDYADYAEYAEYTKICRICK